MSKSILITGASSGLGKAAAILFSQKGWKVYATMRKPENESELDKLDNVHLIKLDVTDQSQIDQAAKKAIDDGGVNVLLNNAGYGLAGPLEAISDAQIENQLNTNLLGVMKVTRAFIPHFREKKNGLIITITSIGGLVAFPYFSSYHATKWALEGWSESLAFELKQFGIGVKTVSPGGIDTDFASRSLDLAMNPAYEEQINKVFAVFSDPERALLASTAQQIAERVYEAATDGKDQLRYLAGRDAHAMYKQRLEAGDESFRKGIAQAFLGE